MKLVNHTLIYVSGSLLVIIGVWAVIFYLGMLDEVRDSIDDGLDNYKMLVIQKAKQDSLVLTKTQFDESNYQVKKIPREEALHIRERYTDTLMFMQNEQDYEPVRLLSTVFSLGPDYYRLDVISSTVEEDDLIEDLSYALVWLYIIIIVSIVIINNVVIKKTWKPFYMLIERLKQFRLNQNNTFTPPETNVNEFRDLNEAVMNLLKRNMETYTAQKQFIENASHELQTPLAIAINKLELLAEENPLDDAQMKNISETLETLERLTRLNRSLLLLSKIENRQFAEEQLLDFNTLIRRQLADFEELAAYRQLRLHLQETEVFEYKMNKDLAFILISNLLKNAMLHTLENGEIRIEITAHMLRFSNSGKAQALDHDKLFRRFYKDPEKKGSTGLGLAIIKTISEHYGLSVHYHYDGVHHFSIHK